jgi:hypothetical protein
MFKIKVAAVGEGVPYGSSFRFVAAVRNESRTLWITHAERA